MKKMFIIAALAIVSFANAQKGSILLAGSVGVEGTKNSVGFNENKTTTFNFSPKVGYQFTDSWTVGIQAGIEGNKQDQTVFDTATFTTSTTTNKTTTISAGPFVRYSKPLSETFSVYADMGVGFQSAKTTVDTPTGFGTITTTQKGSGVYVGITPALFINMKKNFGINFSIGGLGYESLNYTNNGGDNNRFYFNFGQTVNVGISKNF